ncbi:MAG: acyltransferase [Myxococcales bacterium]|nr:acyltransferase [Myxococcales bacterium]
MLTSAELLEALRQLYTEHDESLRKRFQRSLPFADALFDRWERAKRLGFGEGACVYNSAIVIGEVEVGDHSWVGPHTFLDGGYGPLKIGAYCSISAAVHIYTHDTVAWSLSGGVADKRTGPVTIADRCYIGSQSIIGPGVSIGAQSVVAANSFVSRDVPPRTIVGGSPAKAIGRVDIAGDEIRLVYGEG